MTPQEFIKKWLGSALTERAAAQSHFLDICDMLGVPKPADVDPTGKDYGFEVGATKTTGGQGWADVFRRGFFAWEYKGTGKDLTAAFVQLQRYAVTLDNPPLLIVSDIGTTIRIHTNWTNTVSKTYEIPIADLGDPEKRGWLKSALTDPDQLRPTKTRQQLTEEVAAKFAELARSLRAGGHKPEKVAHFINRLIFCMFAEDVKILPNDMFTSMLRQALVTPSLFVAFAQSLFTAMSKGGLIGFEQVKWFNGGLFDDDQAFPLTKDEIRIVYEAAQFDWGEVDPSILGTLFERGLDPDKRSQLGAHYTDREKIMQIINPVIVEPLAAEWESAKAEMTGLLVTAELHSGKGATSREKAAATTARNKAEDVLNRYLKRLADFRVLDPACGSGNFLFLALKALKDLEHRAQVEAEAMGLPRGFPQIGPEVVRGIEINPYAAELARVSVWVGEIQWMLRNGFAASENPILKPLETIECRDALMTRTHAADGKETWEEAEWPQANVVIGNPPFLGSRKMIPELGKGYVGKLRKLFKQRVPTGADFVCFWFEKATRELGLGLERFGLVATNSISGGASREVLRPLFDRFHVYNVWSNEPWTVEGAAVRVAIICASATEVSPLWADGKKVAGILPDLRSKRALGDQDISLAKSLSSNIGISFQGVVPRSSIKEADRIRLRLPKSSFAASGKEGRKMLTTLGNPNGRPNSDVVVPYLIGRDLTRRPSDRFIVDFQELTLREAELYVAPFGHVQPVQQHRSQMAQPEAQVKWWQHWRTRGDLRRAIKGLDRFIVTPRVSKFRIFAWASSPVLPDNAVVVIARNDDTTFGILHSRAHELWALRMGTTLEDRPRYTPTTTFETFPFPDGLTPEIPSASFADDPRANAIAEAARRLTDYRENWLNPTELVQRVAEVVPGYPDRILPKDVAAGEVLKTRTLTKLYNESPPWLVNAHKALDAAVAAAYGWPATLTDDEILARLFALNQQRARVTSTARAESDDEETGDEEA